MHLAGALKERLGELLNEWDRAEESIKQAEFIQDEVVLPSINELRYAGRKIVEALRLSDDDPSRAELLLNDAIFDCMRARHDAVDAVTAFISIKLDALTEELGVDVVISCFPRMPELIAALGEVEDAIVVSREKRTDRDAIYETLHRADLPRIIGLYKSLRANEEIMQARARELASETRKADRRFWWALFVALAGVIVGIVGWFH